MKKIAWITDSTAGLEQAFLEEEGVYVIPMVLMFGETHYKEGEDITTKSFYEKMDSSKVLPTTSQPSTGDFVSLFEQLKKEYDGAIAIHASASLTGAYQGSVLASQITGFHVVTIDSKVGAFPMAEMVRYGVRMYKEGKSLEKIIKELKNMPERARLFLNPGSLKQLHKGGRVSGSQQLIAQLINLNVVVKFQDGKAVLSDKVRTAKKTRNRIMEYLEKDHKHVQRVSVIHANALGGAEKWAGQIKEKYPHMTVTVSELSPVPGAHVGSGTLGLGWVNEVPAPV
ncbi:DegV family protein (plasmid) [Pontibacillus sp. ALD_SL1]|uniref:DegV family protein n=1 Tax=Pontibacillus sp. ALD_SL1 TaxID=2777185 RepID=UPI001A96C15D|nr:DegV family protein [Pontibacillus sp. ALD_SL1]QST02051.1 DegV family protein [Pontibacillus sp. ALD_SL1]